MDFIKRHKWHLAIILVYMILCPIVLVGFDIGEDALLLCQDQWREIRFALAEKAPGDDFSQKMTYQAISDSEKTLYRALYEAAFLHDESANVSGYDSETVWRVFTQMEYDSPELFFLDMGDSPTINTNTKDLLIERVHKSAKLKYAYTADEADACRSELQTVLDDFLDEATQAESDKEKAELARSWVIDHVKYDDDAETNNNIYSALVKGKAACGGYALSFTWLMHAAGLSCDTIIGYADPGNGTLYGHAWNRVLLDGEWKYLDITWDDKTRTSRKYAFVTEEAMTASKHYAFENNVNRDDD